MKKYVRIVFRSKEVKDQYIALDKWKEIIQSDKTLIPFTQDDEEWQGSTFNKADIVWADYDEEYTNKMNATKFTLYRNIETNTILKMLDGELPDDLDKYEKM